MPNFATSALTLLCWVLATTRAAEKPVVVFRLDDVQAWWCEKQSRAVIDSFVQQNVPVNVGIISQYLSDSSTISSYLLDKASNPLVEMVSHSFMHQTFMGQTLQWQENDLNSANSMINTVTGKTATSFIPPFNQYSDNVFTALKQTGFNVMSGECAWYPAGDPNEGTPVYCPDGSDVVAPDIMVNGVYSLPTGAVMGGMAYWNDYHQPADYNVAMGWINAQIANQGFAVVMLHPVEFGTDNTCNTMATQKLTVLNQLLAYGKTNWRIMTYQDAAYAISNQTKIPPTAAPSVSPTPAPTRAPSVTAYPTPSAVKVGFRLDDVQSWWCEAPARAIMDLFEAEAVPLNVGLIAGFLSEWSPLVPYLQTKVANPLFQFVSNSDAYSAYSSLSLSDQQADLAASIAHINTYLGAGVTPSAFIPPMDLFNPDTFTALLSENFTTMSGICQWNLQSSPLAGTAVYCPAGSDSSAPGFKKNGVFSFPAGAVLGDQNYWNDFSQPPSQSGAQAWIEAQIANQGFSVLKVSPYEFATDGGCSIVNTAKIEVLRSVIRFAKLNYKVSTFSEMAGDAMGTPTPVPTPIPSAEPTAVPAPKSSLKLEDDFKTTANWEKNLDSPTGTCGIVPTSSGDESHASCSLPYCPTCFAAQYRVASALRSTVMPSSTGLYWVGFRLRVPSTWTWDGASQSAVLVEIMRGDKTSTKFPIFALSLNSGSQFGVQICGSSAASPDSVAPVCTFTANVAALTKGVWYDWVVRLNMNSDLTGQGSLDVWVNGVSKLSSRPVLTSFKDVAPPYLQVGVSNPAWGVVTTVDPSVFCPAGFGDGYVNGKCYRYVSTPDSWINADAACADKGGRLATTPDKFTYDWIQRKFNAGKTTSLWVGYNDIVAETKWVWSRVASATNYYVKWDTGKPAKTGSTDCAMVFGTTGSMRDEVCTTLQPYVCEYVTTTKDVDHYCPANFKDAYYNGYCYRYSATTATFASSQTACAADGGHLTTVKDADMYAWFVNAFRNRARAVWIGLNDITTEGSFKWINGDTTGYIEWDRYEPSVGFSANTVDCVSVHSTNKMRDRNCNDKIPSVCQIAATPPTAAPTPPPSPNLKYQVDIAKVRVGDASSCFNEVSTSPSAVSTSCVGTFSEDIGSGSSSSKKSNGGDSSSGSDTVNGGAFLGLLVTCLVLIALTMVVVVVMFVRQSSALEAAMRAPEREPVRRSASKSKGYDELVVDTDDPSMERRAGSRFLGVSPLHANSEQQV